MFSTLQWRDLYSSIFLFQWRDLKPLMSDFVLNISFLISMLLGLHLNFCSKMIFEIWNNVAEEGCVRSNQKLFANFEWYINIYPSPLEENSFVMFMAYMDNRFVWWTLLWFDFYEQWLAYLCLYFIG